MYHFITFTFSQKKCCRKIVAAQIPLNYLLSLLSHFWLAIPQLVLQAD